MQSSDNLSELMDYEIDMSKTPWRLALHNGKPRVIRGEAALRQWIAKAMRTPAGRFAAYTEYFGSTMDRISPSTNLDAISVQIEEDISETMGNCPYITGVDGFTFTCSGTTVTASYTVHSIYGEISGEVSTDGYI